MDGEGFVESLRRFIGDKPGGMIAFVFDEVFDVVKERMKVLWCVGLFDGDGRLKVKPMLSLGVVEEGFIFADGEGHRLKVCGQDELQKGHPPKVIWVGGSFDLATRWSGGLSVVCYHEGLSTTIPVF